MNELDRIRRATYNARPKDTNPAWKNTHRDLVYCLSAIERLEMFDIEKFIRDLPMDSLDDDTKTYVIGNIRNTYGTLVEVVTTDEDKQ